MLQIRHSKRVTAKFVKIKELEGTWRCLQASLGLRISKTSYVNYNDLHITDAQRLKRSM